MPVHQHLHTNNFILFSVSQLLLLIYREYKYTGSLAHTFFETKHNAQEPKKHTREIDLN